MFNSQKIEYIRKIKMICLLFSRIFTVLLYRALLIVSGNFQLGTLLYGKFLLFLTRGFILQMHSIYNICKQFTMGDTLWQITNGGCYRQSGFQTKVRREMDGLFLIAISPAYLQLSFHLLIFRGILFTIFSCFS